MISLIAVAIVVGAGLALKVAIPKLSSTSVATGIVSQQGQSALGDCPDTPTCQGSESSRESQKVRRLTVSKNPDEAIDTLSSIVLLRPGTQIVVKDERYLHVTFTSRIMGYIDDVEFLLSDDKLSVQVRSASRLGKSDLGANAKRLDSLQSAVEKNI